MIGLSLSFCIKDIIAGKVAEGAVEKIIANTRCETLEHWAEVIRIYREYYWADNSELGEAICWRFVAENKIDQPRCRGEEPHAISQGRWLVDGHHVHL